MIRALLRRPVLALGLAALVLLLAASLITSLLAVPQASMLGTPAARQPGTHADFVYLAAQHSNQCGLMPSALMAYPDSARLQGSCCTAMDEARYRQQVAGLRQFAAIPQVPRDPYDIPARQAKQLLAYHQTIHLTTAQQAVYDQAMSLSSEKGPCCCQCWRWYAFRGLSKHLIAQRGFTARQVADVIGLVDGCGGA